MDLLIVLLDLFNKLVWNKSSSLTALQSFKAKEGRVNQAVESLFQISNIKYVLGVLDWF